MLIIFKIIQKVEKVLKNSEIIFNNLSEVYKEDELRKSNGLI